LADSLSPAAVIASTRINVQNRINNFLVIKTSPGFILKLAQYYVRYLGTRAFKDFIAWQLINPVIAGIGGGRTKKRN
jgi:hypothetical protein